jgi:hypothetical protein
MEGGDYRSCVDMGRVTDTWGLIGILLHIEDLISYLIGCESIKKSC